MKKRKDGQYYRVTFMWQGKRYERKGKTQAEAHEKASELKAALKRGDIGVSGNMTVKAWAYEWLEVYKRPVVGDKQYTVYQGYIGRDILPAIGGKRLKDVKPVELQKIVNARAGQSRSSVDKITVTIKSLFERAYKSDLVPRNPAEFLEEPAATEGTHRSITPEERKAILEVAKTHRAGLWIKTLLYGSMLILLFRTTASTVRQVSILKVGGQADDNNILKIGTAWILRISARLWTG